jgi:hypothetical protein
VSLFIVIKRRTRVVTTTSQVQIKDVTRLGVAKEVGAEAEAEAEEVEEEASDLPRGARS